MMSMEQVTVFIQERIGSQKEVARLQRDSARNPHLRFRADQARLREQIIIPIYRGAIAGLQVPGPQQAPINPVEIINQLRRRFNNEMGEMNTEVLRNQGKSEVEEIDRFKMNPTDYVRRNMSYLAFL